MMDHQYNLTGFYQYWQDHKDDYGDCLYTSAHVARLRGQDSEPHFPELIDYLLDQICEQGPLQPRSSFLPHRVLTSLACLNTLTMYNADGGYDKAIDGLTNHLKVDLRELEKNEQTSTTLVNFDLTLSHELNLLLVNNAQVDEEARDVIGSILAACQNKSEERFNGYKSAQVFMIKNPQTIYSLEAIPDHYIDRSLLEKHFEALGSIATNPAATAKYYEMTGDERALTYLLDCTADVDGSAVASIYPGTYFSICWVLGNLLKGGVEVRTLFKHELDLLANKLTSQGIGASDGLPPDADDSAMALFILNECGITIEHNASLLERWWNEQTQCYGTYHKTNTHNPDVSINIQVLNAYLSDPTISKETKQTIWKTLVRFFEKTAIRPKSCEQAGVFWRDRWNITPMYPTHGIVYVIAKYYAEYHDDYDTDLHHAAVQWILSAQGPDGGFMTSETNGPSVEETAYGLLALKWYYNEILINESRSAERDKTVIDAIEKATHFLNNTTYEHQHPPLWLAKTLYTPKNIIYAAVTAALSLLVRRQKYYDDNPHPPFGKNSDRSARHDCIIGLDLTFHESHNHLVHA